MKNFFNTDIPAWYELAWRNNAIIVKVHRVALDFMAKQSWDTGQVITEWTSKHGNASFTPPREGDCGFLNSFKYTESDHPEWIAWKIEIPNIRETDPLTIHALRKTLDLFFRNSLGLFQGYTGWPTSQLMLVDCLGIEQGRDGACLGISFSPALSEWLKRKTDGTDIEIPEVEQVMKYVHNDVLRAVGLSDRFRCEVTSKGYVVFHVPGYATFLSTGENHTWEYMRFSTHNCDSFAQQIPLLVGVIVMCDLARQAG